MLKQKTNTCLAHAVLLFASGTLCFTGATLWTSDAFAKKPAAAKAATAEPEGVMVRPFKGPKAKTLEEAVIRALENGEITLVPVGFEGDVELGVEAGPYVSVAKANNIQAYLMGTVKMAKQGWSLELSVRNGKDGKLLGSEVLTAPTLPRLMASIENDLLETLDAKLEQAKAPGSKDSANTASAKASPKPAAKKRKPTAAPVESDDDAASDKSDDEPAADESDDKPASAAAPGAAPLRPGAVLPPTPLDLVLSGIGGYRTFAYVQPVGDAFNYALQDHTLPFFGARLAGHWYPAAHFTDGALSNIGISFAYHQSLGAQTKVGEPINKTFASTVVHADLGLRARIPLGDYRLGINAGWGKQQTVVKDRTGDPNDTGVVPDAEYTFYRFGPDVETGWFGWDWRIGVLYRIVAIGKREGQIGHKLWFPGATANGFEANLEVAIPITNQWSIAVGGEFLQIGIDMHSKTSANVGGDLQNAVAGGAIDRYMIGSLGVRWKLDTRPEAKAATKSPAPAQASDE